MSEFDRAVNEMHIICALVPSAAPMFRLLIEGGARLERENAELRARVARWNCRRRQRGTTGNDRD